MMRPRLNQRENVASLLSNINGTVLFSDGWWVSQSLSKLLTDDRRVLWEASETKKIDVLIRRRRFDTAARHDLIQHVTYAVFRNTYSNKYLFSEQRSRMLYFDRLLNNCLYSYHVMIYLKPRHFLVSPVFFKAGYVNFTAQTMPRLNVKTTFNT